VRDDFDLLARHVVDGAQQLARFFGHHDDFDRGRDHAFEDVTLRDGRRGKDGMQRRHHGYGEVIEQRQDEAAGLAAENAELVLQRDDIEAAAIDELGGARITFDEIGLDRGGDRRRIVVRTALIVHRDDRGTGLRMRASDCLLQIRGERRNPATAGQRVSDKGDAA